MASPARAVRAFALASLLASLSGCGPAPVSSPGTSGSGQAGGLPGLNLSHVQTETGSALGATIGPAGGTITTTSVGGTTYRLDVPANAVLDPTRIGAYPVTGLSDLPSGATVLAGVQLVPDGLVLAVPATLTITYAADQPETDRVALAWAGDAMELHRYPSVRDGRVVTIQILHFSGYADTEAFRKDVTVTDANAGAEDLLLLHWQLRANRSELKSDLRTWYADVVKPALVGAERLALNAVKIADSDRIYLEYAAWLEAIWWARAVTRDPTFTVAPELGESVPLAVRYLRIYYVTENAECWAHANDADIEPAIGWSREAFNAAHLRSEFLSGLTFTKLDTEANKLDEQTLLDGSCLKVVIDPDRSYSGTKPGDTGTLHVRVGFSLADGAPRYGVADHPLSVGWRIAAPGDPSFQYVSPDDTGTMETDIEWPAAHDSLEIELDARFFDTPAILISRSDRITKGQSQIVFRSDRGGGPVPQIWAMDEDGGNATPLTNDLAGQTSLMPAWSPDGTKIAFASTRGGGNPQIWVMDADGDHAHQITHFDAPSIWPTWSPDGRRLAFSSSNGDGEGRNRIFVIDATGANETPLTAPESGGGDLSPRWSPDGSSIVFTAVHRQGLNGQQIYVLDLGAGVVRPLTSGDETTSASNPSWSPDGTQIVFVTRLSIAVMNADGTDPRPIFSLPAGAFPRPVWSPDGALIAFSMPWSTEPSRQGIFTIDITGENLKALSPASANETDPDWR